LIVVPLKPSISTVLASRRKTLTALSPLSLVRVRAVPFAAATTLPERSDRTSRTSAAGKPEAKPHRTRRRVRPRECPRIEFHVSDLNGLRRFIAGPRERQMTRKTHLWGTPSPGQILQGVSTRRAVIAGRHCVSVGRNASGPHTSAQNYISMFSWSSNAPHRRD